MYFHLLVAFGCWIVGVSIPSLPEKYLLTLTIMGFIAFLLFLKESIAKINQQFLQEAEEAEKESPANLTSFRGKFVGIRDEDSPFSNDFSYLIFEDGEIEVPLFCRNIRVIQKATQAEGHELIVYYKEYILIDVEEVEEPFPQKLPS